MGERRCIPQVIFKLIRIFDHCLADDVSNSDHGLYNVNMNDQNKDVLKLLFINKFKTSTRIIKTEITIMNGKQQNVFIYLRRVDENDINKKVHSLAGIHYLN